MMFNFDEGQQEDRYFQAVMSDFHLHDYKPAVVDEADAPMAEPQD